MTTRATTLDRIRDGLTDLHNALGARAISQASTRELIGRILTDAGAEPPAAPEPTEAEIAALKAAVEPAGEPGSATHPSVETPKGPSRRRPALAGRKPAKHSRKKR